MQNAPHRRIATLGFIRNFSARALHENELARLNVVRGHEASAAAALGHFPKLHGGILKLRRRGKLGA